MSDPSRGEIWLAELTSGEGHEQAGRRPVLIVSNDRFNAGLSGLTMIVPLTSKTQKSRATPAHILIHPLGGRTQDTKRDPLRSASHEKQDPVDWSSMGNRFFGDNGQRRGYPSQSLGPLIGISLATPLAFTHFVEFV